MNRTIAGLHLLFQAMWIILIFTLVKPVEAANNYISYSGGISTFNYNVEGEAYDSLISDNKEVAGLITLLGGDISINTDLQSSFFKIMYGHKISSHLYLGLMYFKTGQFKADANANLSESMNNKFINIYAKGNAVGTASAEISGVGPKLEGVFPITSNVSVIFGVGVMKATAITKTQYTVDLEYGHLYDLFPEELEKYKDKLSKLIGSDLHEEHDEGETHDVYKDFIPVLSIGFIYKLIKGLSLKTEFERYGHPVKDMSVDVFSTGLHFEF